DGLRAQPHAAREGRRNGAARPEDRRDGRFRQRSRDAAFRAALRGPFDRSGTLAATALTRPWASPGALAAAMLAAADILWTRARSGIRGASGNPTGLAGLHHRGGRARSVPRLPTPRPYAQRHKEDTPMKYAFAAVRATAAALAIASLAG